MFKKILSPIDLSHLDKMGKALTVTSDLAKSYGAEVCFVGVTGATPSALAHSPDEFKAKLDAFAAVQGQEAGITATGYTIVSHDPAVQLNDELEAAIADTGADLVVMATHLPGIGDYIWSGHGAHIAAHSDVSVMLVRG